MISVRVTRGSVRMVTGSRILTTAGGRHVLHTVSVIRAISVAVGLDRRVRGSDCGICAIVVRVVWIVGKTGVVRGVGIIRRSGIVRGVGRNSVIRGAGIVGMNGVVRGICGSREI